MRGAECPFGISSTARCGQAKPPRGRVGSPLGWARDRGLWEIPAAPSVVLSGQARGGPEPLSQQGGKPAFPRELLRSGLLPKDRRPRAVRGVQHGSEPGSPQTSLGPAVAGGGVGPGLLRREDMLGCEVGFSIRASFCDGTGSRAAPLVLPQRWANWLKARTSKSRDPFCFQLKLKPLLRFERSHLKYPPSISPRQQPRDPSK